MPMSRCRLIPALRLALVLTSASPHLPAPSHADTVVTFREDREDGSDGPKETITITQGQAILQRSSDPDHILIFQENPNAIIHIDHHHRSYLRLDRERLEEMRSNIRTVLARAYISVEDYVATLPPAEQDKVRKHLVKKLEQLHPPEELNTKNKSIRYEDTGERTKIGLHECKVLIGWEGDRKVSELFVTEIESLKLPPQDHHTIQVFTEYLEKIAASLPGQARIRATSRLALPQMDSDLFPVMITNFWHDGSSTTLRLRSVREIKVDPERLKVPKGYQPAGEAPAIGALP
ncbi:MAG: hypothetical protein AAF591_06465 [Verrucomicrobiota bacterium]